MKHVVLPITEQPWPEETLLRGLNPGWLRDNVFLIRRTQAQDGEIRHAQGGMANSFLVGRQADWYDVIGNVQVTFLREEFGFQLDAIVDAGGCGEAWQVLQKVRGAVSELGLTMVVRIFFLGEVRSAQYQEEQNFYNEIKKTQASQDPGEDPVKWNCFVFMLCQNPEQERIRNRLLPYLLQMDCGTTLHEVRTCGGIVRELDIHSVESVPSELATKTVCALLTRNTVLNPGSILILGRSNAAVRNPKEQLSQLQQALEDKVPVRCPSSWDLLVQKGGPGGEISASELEKRFLRANEACNPRSYEQANLHQLERMAWIAEAEIHWEEEVIRKACETGNIGLILEQLVPGGDFEKLLGSYQKQAFLNSDRTLTEKDGYTAEAAAKLDTYAMNLGNNLREAVFEARLRLIRARIPALRKHLEEILKRRENAVQSAMSEIRTEGVSGLVENWSRRISSDLGNAADSIRLPGEQEDSGEWIRKQAKALLERIPQPNLEEGRKELAQSGEKLISAMQSETCPKLISAGLSGAVDVSFPSRWIVYEQIHTGTAAAQTPEPVIIRLEEWYMDLHRCSMMDASLFQRKLLAPVTEEETAPAVGTAAGQQELAEDGEEEIRPIRQEKPKLPIYDGILSWVWKRMSWSGARVEAYADTGEGFEQHGPYHVCNVNYRPEDKYEIGGREKFPSGVPLCFRIIYQDRGKDVTEEQEEIRMRAPRSRLEVESQNVREGSFFNKKNYIRLKIRSSGAFSPEHITVASSTGCVHSASWEETGNGWRSELLPEGESWQVVDKPGDLIEYEIIQ